MMMMTVMMVMLMMTIMMVMMAMSMIIYVKVHVLIERRSHILIMIIIINSFVMIIF